MSQHESAKAQLLAQVARTPAPTRAQLARRTAIAIGSAVVVMVAAVVVLGGPKPGDRLVGFVVAVAAALTLLGGRALFAGLTGSA